MTPKQALKRLKSIASDIQIGEWCGSTRQAVWKWKAIPPQHVITLELVPEVGMTRYQMRRDIFGDAPCL